MRGWERALSEDTIERRGTREDKLSPWADQRHYFSYGSLVDRCTMASICPDAVPISRACLDGYRRKYRGNLTLIGARDGRVFGALYRISPGDEQTLDRAEGFPTGCRKKNVAVHTPEGDLVSAFIYLLDDGPEIPPGGDYLRKCLRGAREWGLEDREFLDPLPADG